jgi:alpha-L-fucosidase
MKKCWAKQKTILLLMTALFATSGMAEETRTMEDVKMDWWREARFGMFIHWGLYSVAGGQWKDKRCDIIASWIANEFRIPTDEYESLMSGFTADRYDPASWAALAKKAGMKYAVMTAKHHEGFSLFDSKLTDYTVMNTPAGRDVTQEYLDAFRDAGLRAGLYFSIIDWHHPGYPVKGDPHHPMRDDPASQSRDVDMAGYLGFMHGQVRELLTDYGPVDVMWWDFSYDEMSGEAWRAKELEAMCRELQPQIIMNNRLHADVADNPHGDFATPEQQIPDAARGGRDWETCMTINNTWGYKPHDLAFKSSLELIRNLVDIVSKGGNYLLNVGPRADGTIPQPQIERLEAIGNWMDVNSDSIYGTTASPFDAPLPWGRVTTKASTENASQLYLHVFDWPVSRTILLPPIEGRIRRVILLDGGDVLTFRTGEKGTTIALPLQPRHEAATVLSVDLDGPALAAAL